MIERFYECDDGGCALVERVRARPRCEQLGGDELYVLVLSLFALARRKMREMKRMSEFPRKKRGCLWHVRAECRPSRQRVVHRLHELLYASAENRRSAVWAPRTPGRSESCRETTALSVVADPS